MSTIDSVELFDGRTRKIHTPSRIEASIDLQFGVSITKVFVLESGFADDELSEELHERAMHCLVVLAGGKRLVIQPDASDRTRWNHSPVLRARVYLAERTHGRLVGHTRGLPGYEMPLLELAPFMRWLGQHGFQVQAARDALNGSRGSA